MYRRSKFRPPRELEESAAMRERDELRQAVADLTARNHDLRATIYIRDLEVEKLFEDKIRLATDLNRARLALDFLTGKRGLNGNDSTL